MSGSMFGPLRKKRYSDQVADLIQERIFKQHLETGTSLPTEQELAVEFQVSRPVVREALRILEISGLVRIKKGPSGGIFVYKGYHKPIKKSLNNMVASGEVTMAHLFDVRLLIEPHIAREAALHIREGDIEKLEILFEEGLGHQHDPIQLKRDNLNFHLLLARASGNPLYSILLESVFKVLIESSLDFLDLPLEQHFFKVHAEIFKVISKRDPEKAESLMRADILDVMDRLTAHKGPAS